MPEAYLITDTVNGYAWIGSASQVLAYIVGNDTDLENVSFSRWELDEENDEWDQMTS